MATSFTVMAGDAGFPYEPPRDQVPVPVTVGSPTFRSPEAVVAFWHLNCFSVGLRFSVTVWVRRAGLIDRQTLSDDELSALLKDHPPPRLISFAEWPARNLAYSEHVLDGDAVRIAATQVQPLWPE